MNGTHSAMLLYSIAQLTTFVVFLLHTQNLLRCARLKLGAKNAALCSAAALLSLALYIALNAGVKGAVFIAVLALLAAAGIALFITISRRERSSLSAESVKQSFDDLPAGVMFYFPDGLTKLVNASMAGLARRITGRPLFNGAELWETLKSKAAEGRTEDVNALIITLEDGSAYSFHRYLNSFEGKPLYELIASDVSEEMRLNRELEEKEKKVRQVNARLKALMGRIKYTVMERETAEMRARIHDRFGHALLHAMRCMKDGSADRSGLLEEWRGTIKPLLSETQYGRLTTREALKEEAEALGISLTIDGDLPEDARLLAITETAVSVHLTNVLRHAEGTRALVSIRENGGSFTMTFTNDGKAPVGPVNETGGLRNLRAEAERIGGSMKISCEPEFRMVLELPGEGLSDGI
ncbi:MAG: hypothetical protein IKR08_07795 [Firmicutes bacterium]|nr:hypothetical protein [Bacillota bacterium]